MLVLIRFGITVSIAKDVKVFLIFLKFGLENFFITTLVKTSFFM